METTRLGNPSKKNKNVENSTFGRGGPDRGIFHISKKKWCLECIFSHFKPFYRVSGLSCPEAGGCKSAILRGFPDVFSLFGPFKVGEISFRYS